MEIFRLNSDFDDPRFESIDLPAAPSLAGNEIITDDLNGGEERTKLSWQPRPLADIWVPLEAENSVRPFIDYSGGRGIPIFSRRAVDALRTYLEPNGELLPINTNVGTYFIYNILFVSSALDASRSKLFTYPGNETANDIEYFAFDEGKLEGHSIFRIRQAPYGVYVTSGFRHLVELAGLNGFYFAKVWPMPDGESWEQADIRLRRERRKQLAPLKGQAVIISLGLPAAEATEGEEEQGMALAMQLDKLLAECRTSFEDDFVASISHFDTRPSELLIVLVGPDADRIMGTIHPWIKAIDWPNDVHFEKIYGNIYDEKAPRVNVNPAAT